MSQREAAVDPKRVSAEVAALRRKPPRKARPAAPQTATEAPALASSKPRRNGAKAGVYSKRGPQHSDVLGVGVLIAVVLLALGLHLWRDVKGHPAALEAAPAAQTALRHSAPVTAGFRLRA